MLAITFDLHGGVFQATDPQHPDGEAEWPPHACRAFSAIVAALHADTACAPCEHEAVEALEHLGPPTIYADAPEHLSTLPTHLAFVPQVTRSQNGRAFDAELWPALRAKNSRARNAVAPFHPQVSYVWPDATLSDGKREALSAVLRRVTRLGDGTTLAGACLSGIPAGLPAWRPVPSRQPDYTSTVGVRVPVVGRLAHLEAAYQCGRRPDTSMPIAYTTPGRTQPVVVGQDAWSNSWAVWRLSGNYDYAPGAAYALAKAFRSLVLDNIRRTMGLANSILPSSLSGHSADGERAVEDLHPAFVPLPFVGGTHATGRVMGIAVIPHQRMPMADLVILAKALRDASGALKEFAVDWPGVGSVTLSPCEANAPKTLTPSRWSRPSSLWATVLPYRFEGMRKHPFSTEAGCRETVAMVTKSCRRLGLPNPVDVQAGRLSLVRGAAANQGFTYPGRHGVQAPTAHLSIRFPSMVAGPILIGADRHAGFGLCAPIVDTE